MIIFLDLGLYFNFSGQMKKLAIIIPLLFIGIQLPAKNNLPPVARPKSSIKWETKAIDLGTDVYGNQKTATFNFTNIGKSPVKIVSVKFPGYWGPLYSYDSILPGKKGFIELSVITSDASKGYGICKVTFSNGETESLIVNWQKLPSNLKWKTTQINNRLIYFTKFWLESMDNLEASTINI